MKYLATHNRKQNGACCTNRDSRILFHSLVHSSFFVLFTFAYVAQSHIKFNSCLFFLARHLFSCSYHQYMFFIYGHFIYKLYEKRRRLSLSFCWIWMIRLLQFCLCLYKMHKLQLNWLVNCELFNKNNTEKNREKYGKITTTFHFFLLHHLFLYHIKIRLVDSQLFGRFFKYRQLSINRSK